MINTFTRRGFLRTTGVAGAATWAGIQSPDASASPARLKTITVAEVNSNFECEPLIRPFGFKGGYMTEIWQTVNYLKSSSGVHQIGLCTQNVLWPALSNHHKEAAAIPLMAYNIPVNEIQSAIEQG